MKKFGIFAALIMLVGVITFTWTSLASAHTFRTGDNVHIGQAQTINSTLFTAGRTIDIGGEVFGDVFCAGTTVTITATVHGDVICAGQTVSVRGEVDGDIRLAGQTVNVGAEVSGNATVAAQTFTLDSDGSIQGDVSVAGDDTILNGEVGRDIAGGVSSMIVANNVGRNINATVNNLELTRDANIGGDINFTSSSEINRANGAVVSGEIVRSEPSQADDTRRNVVFGFSAMWFLYWFLAMLLTALALALLFPRMLHAVTDQALSHPWRVLLTGFAAGFVMPMLIVLLAITIIGLPLAMIVGLLWLTALILSGPIFGYYIGRMVLRGSSRPLFIMLVGATILIILYFIPILGIIALLLASWLGTGMLLLEAFNRTPAPAYNLVETNTSPTATKERGNNTSSKRKNKS